MCSRASPNWRLTSSDLIEDVQTRGFGFTVVLADSLYGESWEFRTALWQRQLPYVLAIRGNHSVWTAPGQHKRYTNWRPSARLYARHFTDGTSEQRFVREILFGGHGALRS